MEVLGVRVDEISRMQVLEKARQFFLDGKQHTIFTPNPEMLVDAQKDEYFRVVLNSGSLNICDGKGIELVSRGKLQRIPGIDFMFDICQLALDEGKKIYLLGSQNEQIVRKTKEALEKQYHGIKIVGAETGGFVHVDGSGEDAALLDRINIAKPEVLFVGFGHGKQEKWIHKNLPKLTSVRVAMGVGGAFDMLGGKFPRAPRLLRTIGLEWLWRLVIEPSRFRRIWKATVMFLFLFYKNRSAQLYDSIGQ